MEGFFTIKYEIKEFYLLNPALQIKRRPVQFLHNGGYKSNSCRLWLPGLQQHLDLPQLRGDTWHTGVCRAWLYPTLPPALLPLVFIFCQEIPFSGDKQPLVTEYIPEF